MYCPHYKNSICTISTNLISDYEIEVKPTKEQCIRCKEEPVPCSLNRVTASLVYSNLYAKYGNRQSFPILSILTIFLRRRTDGIFEDPNVLRWDQIGEGSGRELKNLFAKVNIYPSNNCDCVLLAKMMNDNGIEWCKKYKKEISTKLMGNLHNWLLTKLLTFTKWFLSRIFGLRIIQWPLIKFFNLLIVKSTKNAKTTS